MSKRTEIRTRLVEMVKAFVSPGFGSYPTVNIKDFDIAGLYTADSYPMVNLLTMGEDFIESNIGQSERNMQVTIDVIPWADEDTVQVECDKIYKEFPDIIYNNPQLKNLAGTDAKAVDSMFLTAQPLRMRQDCPAMKIRFILEIRYRESRPL